MDTRSDYDDLVRFCQRQVRDIDLARDIVQDTYLRFLSTYGASPAAAGEPPWALLRRIARHLVVDHHRRARVRRHDDIDELAEAELPVAPRHLEPEAALASLQAVRAYVETLEALPPRCREAFLLHVFDELPHARIAERMGISYSMVEKHIVRAMVACKQCERSLAGRADAPRRP